MSLINYLFRKGITCVVFQPDLPDGTIPLPPGHQTVTVLIADSDARTTRSLQRALEGGGYAVLVTQSGRQALKAVYDQRPDVVLLGAQLPEMKGVVVCEQLKSDQNLGFLPVIMLANDITERFHTNGGDLDPDAVMVKPVDSAELATWLQIVLKLKAQFDRKLDRLAAETRRLEVLRSEIITNISHELNTPLLQVKSAISLLAEDVQEAGIPEQTRVADMAVQALARLEHEIQNIRQLARTHDIRLGPVVLTDTVQRAVRHLERSWKSREGVGRVENHVPVELPFVLADKLALARLLHLLIDNALKFSDPADPVLVEAHVLDDARVWVGVQDFGIGISPDEHDHIFEPFYKVDRSATQRYGGAGSGLALAMLLASGMNLTITVDSTPGEGSTFSFVLLTADLDDASPY